MELDIEALNKFGEILMERVRDRAIKDSDILVTGRSPNSVTGRKISKIIDNFTADQISDLLQLVPVIVDVTLHHLLWTFEQEEEIEVTIQSSSETSKKNLRELSDGLDGELMSWVAKFSKERSLDF